MTHDTAQLLLAIGLGAFVVWFGYIRYVLEPRSTEEIIDDVLHEDGDRS